MGLEVEWDASKAELNYIKHGVRFDDAISVFRDPLAMMSDDPDHSDTEQRAILVGHSANRLLVVSFTERRGRVRLISARRDAARAWRL